MALLALRDLVRACERCAGLPAAMAAARVLLGEEPPVLTASALPVAPDDDEPAVGDLPVVDSQEQRRQREWLSEEFRQR